MTRSGGARPTNPVRRGAVYAVRFRLPADIAFKLGAAELQRSLETRDFAVTRRLGLRATTWFKTTMEMLKAMEQPTRAELENAARSFFENLKREVDRPRNFGGEPLRLSAASQVESSQLRVRDLDEQLITNTFDLAVDGLSEAMLSAIGLSLPDLDQRTSVLARHLAARAAREQMLYFIHQLSLPATICDPSDQIFRPGVAVEPLLLKAGEHAVQPSGEPLSSPVAQYQQEEGPGGSASPRSMKSAGCWGGFRKPSAPTVRHAR